MESYTNGMDLVQFIGKLGDLKDEHYHMTLAFSAMIELFIDKGLISRQELERKMVELDPLMSLPRYPKV